MMDSVIETARMHLSTDYFPLAPDLVGFEPITLGELIHSDAKLLIRKEKKFLMTFEQCRKLLSSLHGAYRVLEIDNNRVGKYETLYYDTESFTTYLQHHNGKSHRYKLRSRHYFSTKETYLEVKERQNTGRTVKKRLETGTTQELTDSGPASFLRSVFPYDFTLFRPVLTTACNRVTLVSNDLTERVTLDLFLSFQSNHAGYSYPGVVVGEIKYDRDLSLSQAFSTLKKMGIRKTSFSKYCLGVSLLYTDQKCNRFKSLQMKVNKLTRGGNLPW
jgi:hypothetical protein